MPYRIRRDIMINLIYDANFIVAFIDKNDKWHKEVNAIHEEVKARDLGIVYFDCVANEVISVLGKRFEEKGRDEEFKEIIGKFKEVVPKEKLSWIYPNIINYYDEILTLMAKSKGRLNFHDALISVTARKMALKYIVSFDEDFDKIEWFVRIKDIKGLRNIKFKEVKR